MKKVLKIGIIFLLCIQILNLNIALAGNENNSDKITIFLCQSFDDIIDSKSVQVLKSQKISSLDSIVGKNINKSVQYIFHGMTLNSDLTIGDVIKENRVMISVVPDDNCIDAFIIGLSNNIWDDCIRSAYHVSNVKKEVLRLKDNFYAMQERTCKKYRRLIYNIAKYDSMSDSKDKFPTVIPKKSDSISTNPLPICW